MYGSVSKVTVLLLPFIMALTVSISACSDPGDARSFSISGVKLGMSVSDVKKILRSKGLNPFMRDNIWIKKQGNGRVRVIFEAADGIIWKVFYAEEGTVSSPEDSKKRVNKEFGDPDEEGQVESKSLGNGIKMLYQGDKDDKTAIMSVKIWNKVVTWDLVSKNVKLAAKEKAIARQAEAQKQCQDLLNKPVNELSVNERMEAMGCATKPIFKEMMKQ
jgi:hypothetical protein